MPIDYRTTGADDGYNHSEAVQPVDNGEAANQTVLRRPSENLRTRTEALRQKVNQLELVMQSDRTLRILSAPTTKLTWDKTAQTVTLNGDLYIAPLSSAAQGGGTVLPVPAMYYYIDGGNKFKITANTALTMPDGANDIFVKIFKNGRVLAKPVITLSGADGGGTYPNDGPILIGIEISTDDTNTLQDVVNALVAPASPALPYLEVGGTVVISGGTSAVLVVAEQRIYDSASSTARVDAEMHHVSSAVFNAFSVSNPLADGDSIILGYRSAESRLEKTETDAPLAAYLAINTADSRSLGDGHAITICKRFGDYLYFFNGKVFEHNVADYIAPSTAAIGFDRLALQTGTPDGDYMVGCEAKSTGILSIGAGTLNAQLKSLVALGSKTIGISGDHYIGADVKNIGPGVWVIADGSVHDQIEQIVSDLNKQTVVPGAQRIGNIAASSTHFTIAANDLTNQIQAIANLGTDTGTSGDTKIGADAKTSGPITLALGTVNGQVTSLITQIAKATTTCGAALVGADAKSHSAYSVAQGTVNSQLTDLITHLADHEDATGVQHAIGKITNRPFVVVDTTSGKGDYTSIAAAFAGIAATGGVIYVNPNTYVAEHINDAVMFPVWVIGHQAKITTSGSSYGLHVTAAPQAPITFIGFVFEATADYQMVYDASAPGTDNGQLEFINCTFDRSGVSTTSNFSVVGQIPHVFRNCRFLGADYDDSNGAIYQLGTNPGSRVEVYSCVFQDHKHAIQLGNNLTNDVAIVFDNNRIVDCGWVAAGVPSILVNCGDSTAKASGIVSNNLVTYTGAPAAANSALFFRCGSGSKITVRGNNITRGCQDYSGVATPEDAYMIRIDGGGKNIVTGNYIDCGLGGGVYGVGRISDNNFVFAPDDDNFAAIEIHNAAAATVVGNTIEVGNTDHTVYGVYLKNALNTVVANNVFTGDASASATFTAILGSTPKRATITGNTSYVSNTYYGIRIEAAIAGISEHVVITGNTLHKFRRGIQLDGVDAPNSVMYFTITGNMLELDSVNGTKGIYLESFVFSGTISGNTVYGIDSGDVGIDMSGGSYVCFIGNALFHCATAYTADVGATCGVGSLGTYDPTLQWV